MRLDNILFRAKFAPTIPAARQLISHGHVLVNKKKINIPSYNCQIQDQIKICHLNLIKNNDIVESIEKFQIPSYLKINTSSDVAEVNILNTFNNEDIGLKVNELLMVEYYSRS